MPVFSLSGRRNKALLPYQEADYTIAETDRRIEQQYDIRTLELRPDYSGKAIATLLRHDAAKPSSRSVLYIHGYGDYFFHDHVRRWYNELGYNFYALDLRKHGRSLLPHQRACYAKDLREYFEEISATIRIITQTDGNEQLIIQGHSTGALTTALYADRGDEKARIDGLVLNSPFFAVKASGTEKKLLNLFATWSQWQPSVKIPVEFEGFYGKSLHRNCQGEWDYTLAWKPIKGHPLHGAWIRAINRGHQLLYRGLNLKTPVLILRSDKSVTVSEMSDSVFESDIVLDVADMENYSSYLGTKVQLATIEDALHDVFLSKASVRGHAFQALDKWLGEIN